MALREIDEKGNAYDVFDLPYRGEFDQIWFLIRSSNRDDIEAEISRRLDCLTTSPDPNWGSITNTSIEGGRTNPETGIKGDWTGTVFQPIFEVCGCSEERAGMFYGNVWKWVIIHRHELWIGLRTDPTFEERGITLQGKTYFLSTD